MLEVYSKIKDYENYGVSNYGEVINIRTGRKLKQIIKKGYLYVGLRVNNTTKVFSVHRLVANTYLNPIENKNIADHKDNNPKNNRLDNLRFCNQAENTRNAKIKIDNKSGTKGVNFVETRQKWRATITFNGKRIHIGCYEDIEQAKIARKNKASELFKEFINECEL